MFSDQRERLKPIERQLVWVGGAAALWYTKGLIAAG
jgi:hypothetical protein